MEKITRCISKEQGNTQERLQNVLCALALISQTVYNQKATRGEENRFRATQHTGLRFAFVTQCILILLVCKGSGTFHLIFYGIRHLGTWRQFTHEAMDFTRITL